MASPRRRDVHAAQHDLRLVGVSLGQQRVGEVSPAKERVHVNPTRLGHPQGSAPVGDGVVKLSSPQSTEAAKRHGRRQGAHRPVRVRLSDRVLQAGQRQRVVAGEQGDPTGDERPFTVDLPDESAIFNGGVGPAAGDGIAAGHLVQRNRGLQHPGPQPVILGQRGKLLDPAP